LKRKVQKISIDLMWPKRLEFVPVASC